MTRHILQCSNTMRVRKHYSHHSFDYFFLHKEFLILKTPKQMIKIFHLYIGSGLDVFETPLKFTTGRNRWGSLPPQFPQSVDNNLSLRATLIYGKYVFSWFAPFSTKYSYNPLSTWLSTFDSNELTIAIQRYNNCRLNML